ncbi:MAG: amidohydrolase family protein [Planctomycetota bacterium]
MSSGHCPTPRENPGSGTNWSVEATCVDANGRRRSRLEIDTTTGRIVGRSDPDGTCDWRLDDELLLLPGFVDIHVHCRDDPGGDERYKEDFGSASLAALHGGVVLVGDMPNNPQAPVDTDSYESKRQEVLARAKIDVVLYGGVGPGTVPFGQHPYKCYYGPSVGDLNFVGKGTPATPLAHYGGHFVAFHAESEEVLEACAGAATHEERRPAEAEARAVAEILDLAREIGFRPHIAHLSSAAGLEEIRKGRAAGLDVTCEVTPHHLFFDDQNRGDFEHGDWLQMNPPLRTAADRAALMEAFANGEIDILATDHAPHSLDENERGISGVPLLDTFGAFVTLLAAQGIPWEVLVERCCRRPAELFAPFLDGPLGTLEVGSLASFAVVDPTTPWRVQAEDVQTRASWSPFEGAEFPGRVAHTVVRGQIYDNC